MQLAGDTPMHRVSVLEMTAAELDAHVDRMRVRRMAAHIAYKEAQEAKARLQADKDVAQYAKRLEQLAKVMESMDKSFGRAEKYITDIKVLRLSLGDRL